MRRHTGRHRMDPILVPDQFGVARPLQLEDLDSRVTRQGIYPSLPAPNGVPWSEIHQTHVEIDHLLSHPLLNLLNQIKQGMLPEG